MSRKIGSLWKYSPERYATLPMFKDVYGPNQFVLWMTPDSTIVVLSAPAMSGNIWLTKVLFGDKMGWINMEDSDWLPVKNPDHEKKSR